MLRVDADTFDRAGRLEPASLRTLDALHVSAAMTLGPDLSGIAAYDMRLLDAARSAGIPTASPGV